MTPPRIAAFLILLAFAALALAFLTSCATHYQRPLPELPHLKLNP